MYILKAAYARPAGSGNRWAEVDLATLNATPLINVNQNYRDLRMILEGVTDPDVDLMFNFAHDVYNYLPAQQDMLVSAWFTWLGNKSLPTSPTKGLKTKYAVAANPWDAGYKVNTTEPGARPDDNSPPSARRDLLLTHAKVKPKTVFENALVSVCGFIHRLDYSEWGLYVKEGGITNTHSNSNTITMMSFAALGGVQQIPITEDMISGLPTDGSRLNNPLYISAKDYDWSTSTAFLCLGGKLLSMGDIFRPVGNGLFELQLHKFQYLQWWFEADKVLDLSSVKDVMPVRKENDTMLSLDDFYGADAIKAFLMLSQSFIVAVKTPGVFVEKWMLETSQQPGVFITERQPKGILVNNTGRILDYLLITEFQKYCLHTVDDLSERRQYWDADWRLKQAVDAKRPTIRPYDPVQAWMMEIGADTFM